MRFENERFALSLGVLAVLLVGIGQTAWGYEYASTFDSGAWADYSSAEETATHWCDAMASADANSNCSSQTHAYADANDGDSASAWATAEAYQTWYWDWDGPPGTAPGGQLSWSNDSSGSAEADGGNLYPYGSGAHSSASAYSAAGAGSSVSSSSAGGSAHGSVTNGEAATGSASASGSPAPYINYPTNQPGYGWFHYSVSWAQYVSRSENISAGTTNIYFSGESGCSSSVDATEAGSKKAAGYSYASALAGPSASFSSN
jgi:hypothetical protein